MPAAPRLSRVRFLAFGDSLTAGTTSPALTFGTLSAGLPQSYPFKLQTLLAARYTSQVLTIENEGKPGEAAVDGVLRFPSVLRATTPEVVILMHGVNDLSVLGPAAVNRVADYVNRMASDARNAGDTVFICTLPLHRKGGSHALDEATITAYNRVLRDVARGEGATVIDFEREVDIRLVGADGLHLTEAGYGRMADVLFAAIRTRFEITP